MNEFVNVGPQAKGRCSGHNTLYVVLLLTIVMIESISMNIYSYLPWGRHGTYLTALQ